MPENRFLDYPDLFFYTHFSDLSCHMRLAAYIEKSDSCSGTGILGRSLESNMDERLYLCLDREVSVC